MTGPVTRKRIPSVLSKKKFRSFDSPNSKLGQLGYNIIDIYFCDADSLTSLRVADYSVDMK